MLTDSLHGISAAVFDSIAGTVGQTDPASLEIVGGGSINRTFRLQTLDGASFLLKTNSLSSLEMFAAELEALQELRRANAIRVPEPIMTGSGGDTAFLLLEYIEFGNKTAQTMTVFGHALAAVHRKMKPRFGWHRDNTIGSTLQINDWTDDWVSFWRVNRLGYQLRLAASNGLDAVALENGQRLLERLPEYFSGYAPSASLLHGDLWDGNWAATYGEKPVIYDPASYYGDREVDIAMTRLFGGFSPEFYAAYNEAWPLDVGFGQRRDLYNLYHVLNHFNLFGGGYRGQVIELLEKLLR